MPSIDPRVLIGVCLGLLGAPQAARADGVGCVLMVRADGLGGRWARALADVQRVLAARDDVDRCVELIVTLEARGIRVVARLPTGDDATRVVDSPDSLGPTILALLLVPTIPERPARSAPAPASIVEPPAAVALPRFEATTALQPPSGGGLRMVTATPVSPAPARFEIGVGVGARWQGGVAVGVGGFADVALGRWLVGASGRWSTEDGEQVIPANRIFGATRSVTAAFRTRSLEIGVELGRRFVLGPLELTALLGPRIAMRSRDFGSLAIVNASTGEPSTVWVDAPDQRVARVGGGLRARWAGSSRLQLVFGIDASVDPTADGGGDLLVPSGGDMVVVVGPPAYPAWGFALTVGGQFQVSP